MKLLVTILTFLTLNCSAQQYVANWTGWGHTSYQIQQGRDSVNWITIGQIQGQLSKSTYQFTVPGATYYYRIIADKDSTCAILVPEVLSIPHGHKIRAKKTSITSMNVKVLMGSQIHYRIETPRSEQVRYGLFDMMGRKISGRNINLFPGVNDVFDKKPIRGVYYGTFQGYFDFITVKVPNL